MMLKVKNRSQNRMALLWKVRVKNKYLREKHFLEKWKKARLVFLPINPINKMTAKK